jgi:hypothetical protein
MSLLSFIENLFGVEPTPPSVEERRVQRWNEHLRDLKAAGLEISDRDKLAEEFSKYYYEDQKIEYYPLAISKNYLQQLFLGSEDIDQVFTWVAGKQVEYTKNISLTDGGKIMQSIISCVERDDFEFKGLIGSEFNSLVEVLKKFIEIQNAINIFQNKYFDMGYDTEVNVNLMTSFEKAYTRAVKVVQLKIEQSNK